ncbi:ASPH-like protein [Mya arenaria]|uniref:ASPH-like protein n=1 Tax=Mya arenaria TaxID=6604 RepID=A0ABY7F6K7_MYAAR|nr:ASPH-like protein [Mya arenaria]
MAKQKPKSSTPHKPGKVEFTQLGLNPFQEVLNLNDDTTPDDYVMHQEGDTLKKDPKQDAHDKLRELDKNAINRNNDLTQDKQDTGKETESDKGSKKDKPRQEDYGKIVITSKGDYKLRKKLDAADKLLEKGEVAKAMEKFDAILRNKSRSPRAMWGKALATDKLAEQQKSNKLLEEAISLMDEALRLSKTPEALQLIIAEKLADRQAFRGAFVPEEENLRETGDWKQFTLYQRGRKNEENCKKVPKTCSLLDRIPDAKGCTRGQIKFSVMHPGVHVWPHTGPTNCRIRAHLGLKVPEGPKIRVGNDIRTWKEGKFIIFDDSFEHEVWHEGTELRLVLIVDFWHPELPAHEKRTLSPI